MGLELWSVLEKWGQVPNLFLNHIRPLDFEQGQTGPEGVWSLTSVFLVWFANKPLQAGRVDKNSPEFPGRRASGQKFSA